MAKRGVEVRGDSPAEDSDLMKITPLGSGQEVQISQSWSWWRSLVANQCHKVGEILMEA